MAQDETVLVETNQVTVNVAVNDKNGKFLKELRQKQFEIFDNCQKQQLTHFSVADQPKISGPRIYDRSSIDKDMAAVVNVGFAIE